MRTAGNRSGEWLISATAAEKSRECACNFLMAQEFQLVGVLTELGPGGVIMKYLKYMTLLTLLALPLIRFGASGTR